MTSFLSAEVHTKGLAALLEPRSIGLIGASAHAERIGGRSLHFLKQYGYAGAIYPINPRETEIQGLPAFKSIAETPEAPDLVVVSVAAAQVIEQLTRCADRGVKAAIVFSAGFSEAGEAGAEAQAQITALAKATGLRVLGPNCLGVMSIASKVLCTFGAAPNFGLPEPGGLSIVSQSGAFGTYTFMAGKMRGLPIARWISTGNEADVDFADCVAWLADDPDTKVIMGYMEGCRNGRKLMRAFDLARAAGKPVIVIKVGRTEAGAAASQSHTAALAGSDEVFDAVFRQCGVHRAATVDEFFDVGYGCLRGMRPTSARLGVITGSGGAGVLMADAAEKAGLDMAPLPAAAQAELHEMLPFSGTRNPVDITGQAANDPTLFGRFLEVMIRDGDFGAIAVFNGLSGLGAGADERLQARWSQLRAKHPDTPFYVAMMSDPAVRRALDPLQIPVFDEPTRMVNAIAALHRFGPPSAPGDRNVRPVAALSASAKNEAEASDLLESAGIPMAPRRIVTTREAASAAATDLGFPVALKVLSPDIAHKGDVGGVVLNLADIEAVAAAFDAVMQRTRAAAPGARIEGAIVAPMLDDGVEAVIGVRNDPAFGPIVMVGLGGSLVEVFRDVSFRAAPFGRDEAIAMIAELRSACLLDAFRGKPARDRAALADALVALSRFAVDHAGSYEAIEINPLLVRETGQGVVGLDALIA
ncbi:MAG TPA: acetate--CoA ligase family protein [Caulobacteraceae bacterium]|jgi:acyl-CoA synthetase (NDP forming)|nr:acetate--CoA ligase family protein [Caulobacteraceae bacterium]